MLCYELSSCEITCMQRVAAIVMGPAFRHGSRSICTIDALFTSITILPRALPSAVMSMKTLGLAMTDRRMFVSFSFSVLMKPRVMHTSTAGYQNGRRNVRAPLHRAGVLLRWRNPSGNTVLHHLML